MHVCPSIRSQTFLRLDSSNPSPLSWLWISLSQQNVRLSSYRCGEKQPSPVLEYKWNEFPPQCTCLVWVFACFANCLDEILSFCVFLCATPGIFFSNIHSLWLDVQRSLLCSPYLKNLDTKSGIGSATHLEVEIRSGSEVTLGSAVRTFLIKPKIT